MRYRVNIDNALDWELFRGETLRQALTDRAETTFSGSVPRFEYDAVRILIDFDTHEFICIPVRTNTKESQ